MSSGEKRIACPFCGSVDYEYVYLDRSDTPLGCSDCIHVVDGYQYVEELENAAFDEYVDSLVDEALGK